MQICIPKIPEDYNENTSGDGAVVLNGWGREDEFEERFNDSLREARIELFSKNFCSDHYQGYDSDIHLCAGNPVSSIELLFIHTVLDRKF